VLVPVYEPFKDRNGNKLGWIFGSFGIGAGLFLLLVLVPRLQARSLRALRRGKASTQTDLKELLALVVPRGEFFVTPILMHLNIAVFLVMVAAGLGFGEFSAEDALRWGGNFRPLTAEGEWWRLVTSMFLHGGVLHLVANMVGLVFVSVFLEPLLGRGRFILAYLLAGVAGSLASILWHPATVSVGASGAIFGLYGLFLTLLLAKVFPRETNRAFLVSTALFVGYNLLMGMGRGIDNAAHIGGLVMGLLLGVFVCPLFQKEKADTGAAVDFGPGEEAVEEAVPAAQEEWV
jgi:rhomboid protease GluP